MKRCKECGTMFEPELQEQVSLVLCARCFGAANACEHPYARPKYPVYVSYDYQRRDIVSQWNKPKRFPRNEDYDDDEALE